MHDASQEVTQILSAIEQGDRQAASRLLPLVYDELRRLAASRLAHEPSGQTLQATALVHEAYLRLVGERDAGTRGVAESQWNSRGHFFAAAAEAMRRILVEQARKRRSLKRGGGFARQEFADAVIVSPEPDDKLLALEPALSKLESTHPEHARLVNLRYFGGLTLPQAAELMKISTRTAERQWTYARAWLLREIRGES